MVWSWSKSNPYAVMHLRWVVGNQYLHVWTLSNRVLILGWKMGLGSCFGMILGLRSNFLKFNFLILFGMARLKDAMLHKVLSGDGD